jgi:hypothetical protein
MSLVSLLGDQPHPPSPTNANTQWRRSATTRGHRSPTKMANDKTEKKNEKLEKTAEMSKKTAFQDVIDDEFEDFPPDGSFCLNLY